MRLLISFIATIGVMIAGIIILIPVISSLSDELSSPAEIPGSVNLVLGLLPVFIAVALIMTVMGMFSSGGTEADIVEVEPEPEPIEVKRKDAVRILMERYANGEISSEEYTDKMARL